MGAKETNMDQQIAFIGGGNMASALIGGLLRQGFARSGLTVIEPFAPAREALRSSLGVEALEHANATLGQAGMVVWAVKPQVFKEAAAAAQPYTTGALHLSVAAGIRSETIAHWLGNERVIRSMPNTPALIGKGITALCARPAVTPADRAWAERVIGTTGEFLWLDHEDQLDAVTALSGSGPAYMFYFMEAMIAAGVQMGLDPAHAHRLAVATCLGAGELARASTDAPEVLRQRVTSKGGTTYAAITSMERSQVKDHFIAAIHAARERAHTLGLEFGA
jgi:pyrroline-5-carboxylate reductase